MSLSIKVSRAASQGGMAGRVNAGDPGLFSMLGKGLRTIGTGALGFALGGPVGAAVALSGSAAQKQNLFSGVADPRLAFGPAGPAVSVGRPGMFASAAPVGRQIAPPRGVALATMPAASVAAAGGVCPSGFRPNKTSYFLRTGEFVAAGTRCVRRRRRNPANARAMSRAIGRIDLGKRFQHMLANVETKKFTKAGKRKHPHR